jgi:antitoxin MazE
MTIQVGKWGNSLAVRIPGHIVEDLCLKDGTALEVMVVDGRIVLRPTKVEYTLEELLADITPENLHGETDWGSAVGRESW